MQKSLDTAISAVKAQQTKLDVTANNIANVNTVGFKKSRTMFSTMLNQAIRTASAGTDNSGGINPSSIGLGVQVASIDTLHSQGTLTSTGRPLDLAIQGDGFFTVSDGNTNYYTRSGAINLSSIDGSLTLSNGMKVMGYPINPLTGEVDKNGGLQPIKIPNMQAAAVQATTNATFSGNISSSLKNGETTVIPFVSYDSLGTKHQFNITLEKTGNNELSWTVESTEGLNVGTNTGTIKFDTNGKFESSTGGPITVQTIGAENMSIELDFSTVTMLDKSTDFSLKSQNGMSAGTIQSVAVTSGATVTVTYSNGLTKDIACLGIAIFDNPAGLSNQQDSLFMETVNSGLPTVVTADESAQNTVYAGYLEASNVDVSEELTDMIKTQRAYQMATKVVTTSDEILTELINIKR